MRIKYLRTFIKLSQSKSFSKLSKELSISQSTLSHRIFQLEEELGNVTLINRTTKKFELSSEGKLLLEYAQKIVNMYDECKEKLYNIQEKITETIVITTSKLPGSHILPKHIAKFKQINPEVQFKVLINNTEKSINILENKEADFAGIGSFMNYKMDEFEYIKIGDDIMYFICSPNHKLIKDRDINIRFEELKKYPFISREKGSGTRNIFEKQFTKFNELNIKLELNSNNSIISAVSESNYISIASELIAKKAEDAGLIKMIKLTDFPNIANRKIYIIKNKNKKIEKLKKEFWDYLKENT
ncbi:MAG: LysR family transcriptional regulator [Candidatus Lokiarchaeota archaeon]|nr:LysR family transcriptional regulator [Candidatus Lokiarchaeota archaeon]